MNIIEEKEKQAFDLMTKYKNLYEYIDTLYSNKAEERIKKYLYKNHINKVLVYGGGCAGKIVYDKLQQMDGISVVGMVDNSHNTKFGISDFIEYSDLIDGNISSDIILITAYGSNRKIKSELEKNGVLNAVFVLEIIEEDERKMIYEDGISV